MMHLRETRGGEQWSKEREWEERDREKEKERRGEKQRGWKEQHSERERERERLLCIIMTNSEAICMLIRRLQTL